jgi:S-adenosylmethionine:tRNA ribosyltransferase-isomerase
MLLNGLRMRVSDFDFELPDELIAQHAVPRGESRLLALDRATGEIEHGVIGDLVRYLHEGDVLVANNTRVFPARLQGVRVPSGGAVECMLLERDGAGDVWSALVHPGQKLKAGAQMRFTGGGRSLMGEILERKFFGRRSVRLWSESGEPVESLIEALGHVPLPPYIKRADEPDDRERYQTVYAKASGSVAAPTAGLHFTPQLLSALERRGIQFVEVTLHVGYGTFKPVRTEVVEEHVVDPERYTIGAAAAGAINDAKRERRRVIAVGTTTTRALENSGQRTGEVIAGSAKASIFIYPGFTFQIVDALLTNFHLPRSSLLMLVAAFAGRDRILGAYREAVERKYRFYSYGDAMLVW